MARLARCRLQQISIQGAGFGRTYGAGALVNLDEVLVADPRLTVEQALGDRIDGFELVTDTPAASTPAELPDDDDPDDEE